MTLTEEYYVTRPVMQVQSASVPALYRNCKNTLNVSIPALGTSYQPSFTASDADVMNHGGGKVSIIPKKHRNTLKLHI